MEINNYIKTELIKVNLSCKDREDLFRIMHDEAFNHGYVEKSFLNGLLSREDIFPTGIKLDNYSVAIPHTDAEHIKEQFIAVVVPEKPIRFKLMDDANGEEEVSLIFILGLNKPHSQLEVLKELMSLIQKEEVVKKIISAKSIEEAKKILEVS